MALPASGLLRDALLVCEVFLGALGWGGDGGRFSKVMLAPLSIVGS